MTKDIYSPTEAASRQYAIPRWLPGVLILLPIVILAFQLALTFPAFADLKPIFWGENGPLENLQFVLFFLGSFASLRMSWQSRQQGERWFVWLFYLGFSFAFFFIGMEEIAWGQQFLDFNSPEFVKAFNVQNEFTLHNVEALQDRTDIFNLVFGIGALFALWLNKYRSLRIIAAPRVMSFWFILIFALSALGVLNDFVSINEQYDYSVHKQTETVELLIAAAGLGYAWLNLRRFTYRQPCWSKINSVEVNSADLIISDLEGRRLQVPLSSLPWLKAASVAERGDWQLAESGDCINWQALGKRACLEDLLAHGPDRASAEAFEQTPLPRGYPRLALAAGAICLLWLALLPGDVESALLFGWSATRLAMLAATALPLAGLSLVLRRSRRAPEWYLKQSHRLIDFLRKRKNGWVALILALLFMAAGTTFIVISFVNPDPYYRGILARLAPWAFWLTAFAILLSYLVLQINLEQGRIRLAHAKQASINDEEVRMMLSDGKQVSLPLSGYPALHAAQPEQRKKMEFVKNGLRIRWPELKLSFSAQQLASGYPDENYLSLSSQKEIRGR